MHTLVKNSHLMSAEVELKIGTRALKFSVLGKTRRLVLMAMLMAF